ncbi:hypothetical protein V1478_004789 [Vespula squamosa]|uniref:Uncharacterized protein n=1 Tax=Vespula squamosa TaxID=30214 RepID=A0ABD2BEQ8_VESSQ
MPRITGFLTASTLRALYLPFTKVDRVSTIGWGDREIEPDNVYRAKKGRNKRGNYEITYVTLENISEDVFPFPFLPPSSSFKRSDRNDGKRIASSDRVRIIDRRPVSWPRNRERDESPSSPRVKDEVEEEVEKEEEAEDEEDDTTTIGSAFRDLSKAFSASHFFFSKVSVDSTMATGDSWSSSSSSSSSLLSRKNSTLARKNLSLNRRCVLANGDGKNGGVGEYEKEDEREEEEEEEEEETEEEAMGFRARACECHEENVASAKNRTTLSYTNAIVESWETRCCFYVKEVVVIVKEVKEEEDEEKEEKEKMVVHDVYEVNGSERARKTRGVGGSLMSSEWTNA